MQFSYLPHAGGELTRYYALDPFEVDGVTYHPPPGRNHHSAMFVIELDHRCDPDDTGYCLFTRTDPTKAT